MDPRHPELVILRIKELIQQYDRVMSDMDKSTAQHDLAPLEVEGVGIVRELCLTAPRLHEAVIQSSRDNRARMLKASVLKGNVVPEQKQAETVIVEPKPRKKKKARKSSK